MGSKSKEARLKQKTYWESKLTERLSFLADKGVGSDKTVKDTAVRKFRAKIRETEGRLRAIADGEKKVEEMASIKAEKTAGPKEKKLKEKQKTQQKEETSKRQQKKKKKKESKTKAED